MKKLMVQKSDGVKVEVLAPKIQDHQSKIPPSNQYSS